MSKKPKTTEGAFTPEQLDKLETKGDKQVLNERRKEGVFQRYHAARDSKDLARQVKWKRRAGVALIVLLLVLLLLWIISWLQVTIGDLVITVDSGAVKKGIVISESADGSDPQTELSASLAKDVTNITYDWLPATLDLEADGSHNGKNYLAYTFYLSNNSRDNGNPTEEAVKLKSSLKMVRSAKSAEEAIRIMIYRNGVPTVYAKRNITLLDHETGKAKTEVDPNTGKVKTVIDRSPDADVVPLETIYEKAIPEDYSKPSEPIEPEEEQSTAEVETTEATVNMVEFTSEEVVFDLPEESLEPGDTTKYTIIVWVEGNDPECIDDIRGGFVKMNWFFSLADEEL